jgi:hypothetical protein
VAFSPDAVALVTSAGEASVIGVQGAVSTFNLQTTAVLAIALNPTSTLLAVATSTNMGPNITVYNTQNGSIKQSLSVPYFGSITTLAYDLESNLYVAVRSVSGSEIAVYSEGTVRTITAGLNDPKSMQFDNSNNLYVLNYDHDVTVYASGSGSVARTIPGEPGEGPFSIALDSSNDLAIGYSGFIQVFKSGSTTPILVASPHAIYHVTAMAFADGYLYGASSNVETIDIFAPFLKRKPGRDGPIGKLFATNPIGIGVLTEGSTSSGLHNLALAPSSIDFDRKWPDGWDGPAIRHGTISY